MSFEDLTPRQRQILQLMAEGYTQKDIANQLSISFQTVKNTLTGSDAFKGVLERLGACSMYHAIALLMKSRSLDTDKIVPRLREDR